MGGGGGAAICFIKKSLPSVGICILIPCVSSAALGTKINELRDFWWRIGGAGGRARAAAVSRVGPTAVLLVGFTGGGGGTGGARLGGGGRGESPKLIAGGVGGGGGTAPPWLEGGRAGGGGGGAPAGGTLGGRTVSKGR